MTDFITFDDVPLFSQSDVFALFDDSATTDSTKVSRLLWDPVDILELNALCPLPELFAKLSQYRQNGYHAAGWFAYELASKLDSVYQQCERESAHPLIWLGIFSKCAALTSDEVGQFIARQTGGAVTDFVLRNLKLNVFEQEYIEAIEKIKRQIADGNTYQVNFTIKYLFQFNGNYFEFYRTLRSKQRVSYGSLICTPRFKVLSFSPELFFELSGSTITSKPMKGTSARGATAADDARLAKMLQQDEKSRAENMMIVDLIRNDIGRIADVGSVNVSALFSVEQYRTLHQMTSTVTAHLAADCHDFDVILKELFPCGSITGAPKVRTMEIIRSIEKSYRGVYTGAIALLEPNNNARLSVPIRTIVLDNAGNGEMGIGSGIVWDSDAKQEFDECLLKGRFLTHSLKRFKLFETILWEPNSGYFLLDAHLARLSASLHYFGRPTDVHSIRDRLAHLEHTFGSKQRLRVKVTVHEDGKFDVSTASVKSESRDAPRIVISNIETDPNNPFLYHKTTKREMYDKEYMTLYSKCYCEDVIFFNNRGQLTEGTKNNIFVRFGDALLTPFVECGLLNGTLRQSLISSEESNIIEAVITKRDLFNAEQIFISNSIFGLREAVLNTCD